MAVTVDTRGLRCPLPGLHARRALSEVPASEAIVVLATDREAPIDLAAVAADAGRELDVRQEGDVWRCTLHPA